MDLHQKLFLYFSALALLAQCNPTQDPRTMGAIHKKMDSNGDGRLSLNEVIEFSRLTSKDMEEVSSDGSMEQYDTNKDGKVTWKEVMRSVSENTIDTSGFIEVDKKTFMEQDRYFTQQRKDRFEAVDQDKDGRLDSKEFAYFHSPVESLPPDVLKALVMASVKHNDRNGDGKLDSKEYFSFMQSREYEHEEKTEEITEKAFAWLDVDGDGKLSVEELYRQESGEINMTSAFKDLFADADTDKDSHLSLDEFHKHMPLMTETPAGSYIAKWMHHYLDSGHIKYHQSEL